MTRREARRLALLIAWDELGRGLDTSDEWASHPETGEPFTVAECTKVKAEGRRVVDSLDALAARLERSA